MTAALPQEYVLEINVKRKPKLNAFQTYNKTKRNGTFPCSETKNKSGLLLYTDPQFSGYSKYIFPILLEIPE